MSTQPEISYSDAPVGVLLFLRCKKDTDLAEIHSSLLSQNGVTASIPMLGNWNILLRFATKDQESLKQIIEKHIRSVKGVEDFEMHCREETWAATGAERRASVCAVLDVDSGSLSRLTARLRKIAGIVEGNVIAGGRKIVLFLRGSSHREIRNIGSEIRSLPGVLRIKTMEIITSGEN